MALARAGAPFYRDLYANLADNPALGDLPVIDPVAFWGAHQRDRQEILTAPLTGGIVLNSGGSTGAPKFSYLYEDECQSTVEISVKSFDAGLQDGDRVANLFVSGGLHASYLFASDSLRASSATILQAPIGSHTPMPDAVRLIRELGVNVLAGIPTHLLKLLECLEHEGVGEVRLRSIIYAGENFSEAQCAYLRKLFPGVEIHSAGYASVDAGAMAFADAECAPAEHRVFDGATILEILDEETGEPIVEAGKPGRIVFTSLVRRLMPIIRYPSGDRAAWLESAETPCRKFGLLGRSLEDIKLGGAVLIRVGDVRTLFEPWREKCGITSFQLLITNDEGADLLTLRLAGNGDQVELSRHTQSVLDALTTGNPMLAAAVAAGKVLPPRVVWITPQELIVSPRTVKTLTVVDRRTAKPV